jgi:hypothetical protein
MKQCDGERCAATSFVVETRLPGKDYLRPLEEGRIIVSAELMTGGKEIRWWGG